MFENSDYQRSSMASDDSNASQVKAKKVTDLEIELICLKNKRKIYGRQLEACYEVAERCLAVKKLSPEFICRQEDSRQSLKNLQETVMSCYEIELRLNPEASFDQSSELIEHFTNVYFKIAEIKKRLTDALESTGTADNSNPLMNNTTIISSNAPTLPRITLKTFDGTISAWPEYRANFESLIHHHESLTPSAKLNYLRTTLSGPALALVKELPITDVNYPIAWDALIGMYENKRMIGSSLLNKLLSFSAIQKENKDDLSNFMSTFGECVSAIKTQEIADLGDFMTLHIALKCLPKSLVKTFERRQTRETMPTTKDLLKFVQRQIEILDLTASAPMSSSSSESSKKYSHDSSPRRSFTATAHSPTEKTRSRCLCDCDHFLYKCPKFIEASVDERRDFVEKNHLCTICLRSGNHQDRCDSGLTCRVCNDGHNTLLHCDMPKEADPQLSDRKERVKRKNSSSSESQAEQETADSSGDESKRVHQALKSNPTETVLLGTAVVRVKGADGRFHKVRAMIDSASMTTIIRDDCARRLGLPRDATSERIIGLADQSIPGVSASTVCIIKPNKSGKPIFRSNAVIMEKITTQMPTTSVPEPISSKYRHLQLADPRFFEPQDVQLLIGADIFPYIFTGKRETTTPNEPVALSSVFGWVIVGPCSKGSAALPKSEPLSKGSHLVVIKRPQGPNCEATPQMSSTNKGPPDEQVSAKPACKRRRKRSPAKGVMSIRPPSNNHLRWKSTSRILKSL